MKTNIVLLSVFCIGMALKEHEPAWLLGLFVVLWIARRLYAKG